MFVYEDLIRERSEYFRAACSKEWTQIPPGDQSQEKVIPLPAYHPETFRLYLQCIHDPQADLADVVGICPYDEERGERKINDGVYDLCNVWILADYLGDEEIADKVIDFFVLIGDAKKLKYGLHTLDLVAKDTSPDSKLQQLWVDYIAAYIPKSWLDGLSRKPPHDFMLLVTSKLISYRRPKRALDLQKYRSDAGSLDNEDPAPPERP